MIRFIIIEDEQMMREMMACHLEDALSGYYFAGGAGQADQGVELCRQIQPELALVDIHVHKDDGLRTAERLMQEFPQMKVILISSDCTPYNCYRISQSNIHGFVDKLCSLDELKEAVEAVMGGGAWFSESYKKVRREYGESPDAFFKILSEREQQVLLRVACGDNDAQIAKKLGISRRTAETHRHNITRKLGVSDASALRTYAVEQGMWWP